MSAIHTAYVAPDFVEHGNFITRTKGPSGHLVTLETTGLNAGQPNNIETANHDSATSQE